MSRNVKKKTVKTIVWSVALYGAETWTWRKGDIRRLDDLEMWVWRRLEKISWMGKLTNEGIGNCLKKQKLVETIIILCKKNWIGHVLRGEGPLRVNGWRETERSTNDGNAGEIERSFLCRQEKTGRK
jgi:hypothetical protein